MTAAAHGAEAGPSWTTPLFPWIKSQRLDGETYFRNGSRYPDYDSSSWPLGIGLGRDPVTGADPNTVVIDGMFDYHVKNAFRLPWRYSRLRIETPSRRSAANFAVENIGHWNGDASRFAEIIAALSERASELRAEKVQVSFALTPFCIIAQRWTRSADAAEPDSVVDTHLAFFYTFATFLQESLAFEAYRGGHSAEAIAAAYQHIYSNAWPVDAIPADPAQFALAKLSRSSLPWDDIRTTAQTEGLPNRIGGYFANRPRVFREKLFYSRLQAHLTVAIAAACRGLASFDAPQMRSPLLQSIGAPPGQEMLASAWLRHVFGSYDYAAECDALLATLARHYGSAPVVGQHGRPAPEFLYPRTSAEQSIAFTNPPMWGGRDEPEGIDAHRWFLFEARRINPELGAESGPVRERRRKIMSANFNEFWNIVVEGTGSLNQTLVDAVRAAMERLYNLKGTSTDAAFLINSLETMATDGLEINGVFKPATKLNFAQGVQYSANISAWRVNIAELAGGPFPVKMFNLLGTWTDEPLYRTLAHELSHLFGKKDPAQLLGHQSFEGLTLSNEIPNMNLLGQAEDVANAVVVAAQDGSKQTASYYLTEATPNGLEGFVAACELLPAGSRPTPEQLAAMSLGPALGLFDYAAECETLLTSLATRHGNPLAAGLRGTSTAGGCVDQVFRQLGVRVNAIRHDEIGGNENGGH